MYLAVRWPALLLTAALLILDPMMSRVGAEPREAGPKSRAFQLTYQTTVAGLKPGQGVRIWLPVPPSNEDQEVTILKKDLPGEGKIDKEPKYGNQVLYVAAKANDEGKVPLSIAYRVQRREVKSVLGGKGPENGDVQLFLKPDAKVPVTGKPLTLLSGHELPRDQLQLGKVLYEIVNGHMRYGKEGTGWGQGDSVWACDSKYGNCSDFHSLFISLARSQKIPAKFEIGLPLPEKHGQGEISGYHCWAKFKPEGAGWVPVDISEASKNPKLKDYYFGNLTEDRVAFSIGRDLTLAPKQDGPPLNFFIYPYAEVDGKPLPAGQLHRKFTYQDIDR